MQFRKAVPEEYDLIHSFYFDVIDGVEGMPFGAGWKKDIYPAPDQIRSLLEKNELYIGIENERIISAMAMNHENNDGYSEVEWQVNAEKNEVFVLHMLAVHPDHWQRGVAGDMVQFAIGEAKKQGGKAIRLDVLKGNLPANKLYEAAGFKKLLTLSMYYPDTGYTDYELYELTL